MGSKTTMLAQRYEKKRAAVPQTATRYSESKAYCLSVPLLDTSETEDETQRIVSRTYLC